MPAAPPLKEVPSLLPREHYTPAPTTAVFRDLLIFEERLKQNAARMKERRRRYQSRCCDLHRFFIAGGHGGSMACVLPSVFAAHGTRWG